MKRIIYDTVGILLIIAAALTGWLPGPGGIPLLLAGLAVLSVHHEWAERWLETMRKQGLKLTDKIFVDRPIVKFIYDVAGLVLLFIAVAVLATTTRNFFRSLGIVMIIFGLSLLLGNRHRLQRLVAKFKQNKA